LLGTTIDIFGIASITNDVPTTFPLGQTIVTYSATDANGNQSTAIQIVTILSPKIIKLQTIGTLELLKDKSTEEKSLKEIIKAT
jgi:hypothetical protein